MAFQFHVTWKVTSM